jgi:predicted GIY-YIG superfamily endonuclease
VSDYCVYIVECADKTLYTGIAKNPSKRVAVHNSGRGARYTRGRRPVKLLKFTGPMRHALALWLEKRIKKCKPQEKIESINRWNRPVTITRED